MKTNPPSNRSFTTLTLTRLLLSAAVVAPGCVGTEAEPTSPDAIVDVPEVQGAVAAEDFCAVADQIQCAGAVGCCSGRDELYASVDECIQKSRCTEGLGAVLGSAPFQSGEITYDADAAGDYLRALASATAGCSHRPDSAAKPAFLVGSRDEGADCTPQAGDLTHSFLCKPGLSCVLALDEATGETKGTCGVAAPAFLDVGDACASAEDCGSGLCQDGACAADIAAEYCVGPRGETAPSNQVPAKMYVDLVGDNSGSSGDVTLEYGIDGSYYGCTITSTLSDGVETTCTATYKGAITNSNQEFFFMHMNSNDGLRVDTICAYDGSDNDIECAGTFNDYGDRADWCIGGSFNVTLWANACSSVWLDGDGHGNCNNFQINSYDNNFTWCTD